MKFPLPHSPFGHVPSLESAHGEVLVDLAHELVSQTIDEYDRFVAGGRRLPRELWKPVKKLESLALYRQRSGRSAPLAGRASQSAATTSASAPLELDPTASDSWTLPEVVTVGSMVGTLDDVMFGLAAPDATAMLLKAAYTGEDLLDAEVVHTLAAPTLDSPFRFLGVKWMAFGLHAARRHRDLVFLEATGVRKLPDGRQIGYALVHSVTVPGCNSLEQQCGLIRGRTSSCYLFSPSSSGGSGGQVDVFMKGHVEPTGHLIDSFAIATTASALLSFARAVDCAQSRKLEHLLERRRASPRPCSSPSSGSRESCGVCSTRPSLFRRVVRCEMCAQSACSRCRVTRSLVLRASRPKELLRRPTVVCTACLSTSNQQSALDVAQAELMAHTPPVVTRGVSAGLLPTTLSPKLKLPLRPTALRSSTPATMISMANLPSPKVSRPAASASVCDGYNLPAVLPVKAAPPEGRLRGASECESTDRESSVDERDLALALVPFSPPSSLSSSQPPPQSPPEASAADMWARMHELRRNAEDVYQFTLRTTASIRSSTLHAATPCASAPIGHDAFELD